MHIGYGCANYGPGAKSGWLLVFSMAHGIRKVFPFFKWLKIKIKRNKIS